MRAALEAAFAAAPRVEEDAVDAALDTFKGGPGWKHASWATDVRQDMSRAIAAADRARGRSYVEWRGEEMYAPRPNDNGRRVATWSSSGVLGEWEAHRDLPSNIIAWSEMPALPSWVAQSPERRPDPRSETATPESPRVAAPVGDVVPFTRAMRRAIYELLLRQAKSNDSPALHDFWRKVREAAFPEPTP